jgi:hypothetical protein
VINGGTILAVDLMIEAGSGGFGGQAGDRTGDGHFVQSGGSSTWGGLGLIFGNIPGTSGSLNLTDAGSLSTGMLGFGNRGFGSVRIDAGSTVTASRLFVAGATRSPARAFTSAGDLTIDGPGTRVSVAGNGDGFSAGYDGASSVTVSGGALLEVARGLLVSTVADGSSMTIEGPGSALRFGGGADAWFDLGRDIALPPDHGPVGQAILTLRDDGRVTCCCARSGLDQHPGRDRIGHGSGSPSYGKLITRSQGTRGRSIANMIEESKRATAVAPSTAVEPERSQARDSHAPINLYRRCHVACSYNPPDRSRSYLCRCPSRPVAKWADRCDGCLDGAVPVDSCR